MGDLEESLKRRKCTDRHASFAPNGLATQQAICLVDATIYLISTGEKAERPVPEHLWKSVLVPVVVVAVGATALPTATASKSHVPLAGTEGAGASAPDSSPLPPGAKPGPSNTGVPAGTTLKRVKGNVTIKRAGAIVDGLDIHGFLEIKAPNVTVRRSIIRGGKARNTNRALVKLINGSAGNFLIEDSTLVPSHPSVRMDAAKVAVPGTFRGVNISGTVDGLYVYTDNLTVKDSYFHDFRSYRNDPNQGGKPSHSDAIQIASGSGHRITHNTIVGASNAAVMITQDSGPTSNLWINDNWIDGGACSLSFGSRGAYKRGMEANNNRFGRKQRNAGCAIISKPSVSDLAPSGNIWEDSGAPVVPSPG